MIVYDHFNITICSPFLQLKSLVIIKTVIIALCYNLPFFFSVLRHPWISAFHILSVFDHSIPLGN